jgi:HAD superfamily hydrolase (TIGR01509 family)
MIKCLVFDFDGLIMDTESSELTIWKELFKQHGCELDETFWRGCIGLPQNKFNAASYLEETVGRKLDWNELKAYRSVRSHELNDVKEALPGIEDTLQSAGEKGIKLAVASSSDRNWVQGHLDRLGLTSHFTTLVCAEDTDLHKPNPDPYLEALKRMDCTPSEGIAFEDSPNGLNAAVAAGLFSVAIPGPLTNHFDFSQADLVIKSLAAQDFDELLQLAQEKKRD